MTATTKQTRPAGNGTGAQEVAWTATPILQDAAHDHDDDAPRCIACHRHIVAAESVRRGFGRHCWTRVAAAQRHERAAALHARLWSLLRRLPDLDVAGLALVAAALDDTEDALDHIAWGVR